MSFQIPAVVVKYGRIFITASAPVAPLSQLLVTHAPLGVWESVSIPLGITGLHAVVENVLAGFAAHKNTKALKDAAALSKLADAINVAAAAQLPNAVKEVLAELARSRPDLAPTIAAAQAVFQPPAS